MKSALVVFSGGQDSTTCLYWAKEKFAEVAAVTFDYGQRHKIEIEQAVRLAADAGVAHQVINIPTLSELTANSLTRDDIDISQEEGALPSTFVSGRNLIFLSFAAIYAYENGINDIVAGMSQTDYSGYPDCRDTFIKSLNVTLNLAMEAQFRLHTPLMWLTKAETVKLAQSLGCLPVLALTQTCYEGKRPACGECPACKLRLKGFAAAGIEDPLEYENRKF